MSDLRSILRTQGIRQADLARVAGITQQAVSGWVSGRTIPSHQFADAFEQAWPNSGLREWVLETNSRKQAARAAKRAGPYFGRSVVSVHIEAVRTADQMATTLRDIANQLERGVNASEIHEHGARIGAWRFRP